MRGVLFSVAALVGVLTGRTLGATSVGAVRDMEHLRMTICVEPVGGEDSSFQVSLEIKAREDWPSVGMSIGLPKEVKVLSGELSWNGKLASRQSARIVAKVAASGPGIYRIQGNGATSRPTSTGSRGWEGSVYAAMLAGDAKPAPALILPKGPPSDGRILTETLARIGAEDIATLLDGRRVRVTLGRERIVLRGLAVDSLAPLEGGDPAGAVPATLFPDFALRIAARWKTGSVGSFNAGGSAMPFVIEERTGKDGWFRQTAVDVARYAWRADTFEFEWIELRLLKHEEPPVQNVLF